MRQSPANKPTPPVDERLWPLLLVLTVWAAAVSAAIATSGGFDDPRPWMNGVVRLLTVGVTWAALVWAATTIYPQRARRLKIAVAASLAVHSLLAIALHRAWIEIPTLHSPPPTAVANRLPQPKELILPEHVRDPERQRQQQTEFERPLVTDQPTAPSQTLTRQPLSLDTFTRRSPPVNRRQDVISPSAPPPLRHLQRDASATTATASIASQRRRATTRAKLPKRSIAVPEVAIQHHANEESDPSPARPSVAPLARTAPPSSSPVHQLTDSLPPLTDELDPTLTSLPRPATNMSAAQSALPSLPRREPRLAMLSSAAGEGRRFSLAAPPSTPERQPAPAFVARIESTRVLRDRRQPLDSERNVNRAIARGLEFLAGIQRDDGRWQFGYLGPTINMDAERPSIRADAAATGMALLAFFGAGHDHHDGHYRRVVADGLDFLVRVQSEDGELFPESRQPTSQVVRFYGHGIATLALCEAYGMTGDTRLRGPAQRAIDYLVETQHDDYGGWRYVPGTNSDLSVTGWQLIALRSGRLAGLSVSAESVSRIRDCLENCRDAKGDGALFRYNPWASPSDPTTRHGREPSTVMTSVGLVMQLYLDADSNDERIELGAEHLLANLPRAGDSPVVAPTGTLGNPGRDTYYWYYGTQAMYSLDGDYWTEWRARLEPLLVDSQLTTGPAAGSWDPLHPVPDKWATYGGRLYVTALNLLSLEVDYRHLPLDRPSPRMAERP